MAEIGSRVAPKPRVLRRGSEKKVSSFKKGPGEIFVNLLAPSGGSLGGTHARAASSLQDCTIVGRLGSKRIENTRAHPLRGEDSCQAPTFVYRRGDASVLSGLKKEGYGPHTTKSDLKKEESR